MPLGMKLPGLGASVAGEVIWLEDRNCQVKIKLDEWSGRHRSPLGRMWAPASRLWAIRGGSMPAGGDSQ
ncbi:MULTISPECIES: hypothetical protein [Streptomyces]